MKWILTVLSLAACVGLTANAADAPKLEGCKCPLSGKPALSEHHVAYKGANVYFCCPNCPKAFDPAKHAVKANQQLFSTGQFDQTACPFSGQPVKVTADGKPAVGFCCENCLGKYNKADDAGKLELVFANTPFEKGFKLKKAAE